MSAETKSDGGKGVGEAVGSGVSVGAGVSVGLGVLVAVGNGVEVGSSVAVGTGVLVGGGSVGGIVASTPAIDSFGSSGVAVPVHATSRQNIRIRQHRPVLVVIIFSPVCDSAFDMSESKSIIVLPPRYKIKRLQSAFNLRNGMFK